MARELETVLDITGRDSESTFMKIGVSSSAIRKGLRRR